MAQETPGGPLVTSERSNLTRSHEGEHYNDNDTGNAPPVVVTWSTIKFVLCAALNSCNLGYDLGVSTTATKIIQKDWQLTQFQRELLVASINFWAIFGAASAHYFSDRFGRRQTFFVASLLFLFGVLIMTFSNTYAVLMTGRALVGLGVGTGLAIDPLYIAEVSPARRRGELVTWSEIALNVGIVLGFIAGLACAPLTTGMQWRVMLSLGCILPCVMIFLVWYVMPESPRWLISMNREIEARFILDKIYPAGYNVQPIIDDMKEALEREKIAEQTVGWDVLIHPTPAIRRILLVGVGAAIAQQAVGIDAVQYYLLDVIEKAGIKSDRGAGQILILLGLIKLGFVFVGGKLFDRRGRRPLLFTSLTGMIVALLVIAFSSSASNTVTRSFTVIGLSLYLAFFSIGMGPGGWLIPSEVFSVSIRAKAMSVATVMNRITATLMSVTFLTSADAMGWTLFFLLLAAICGLVMVFFNLYLPETKGKSLEEMSVYFALITRDNSVLEAEARLRPVDGVSSSTSNPTRDVNAEII